MPLINGMKMACEPCIRGHRSTKCTHAAERLMVPVRKPGRPLSACPHPRDQACGCGSVTAAIPRKQTCGCGSKPAQDGIPVASKVVDPLSEPMSPSRAKFKVGKPRSQSTAKASFDPLNLVRMDMNQVNVVQPEQRPQNIPVSLPNSFTPPMYGYAPQHPNMPQHFPQVSMQNPPHTNGLDSMIHYANGTNGYSNGVHSHNGLSTMIENSLVTPIPFTNGDSMQQTNGTLHMNGNAKPTSNGGSCCPPRQNGHSQSSSTSSVAVPPEPAQGSCCAPPPAKADVSSCCAPKNELQAVKQEPISTVPTPQMAHQILPPNNVPFSQPLYPQYPASTTVFTYPPTYGSFQNPLQPFAWRESVRASTNTPLASHLPPSQLPFNAPLIPETMDTVHTCSCGDTCQCIGCAAHPYNDATQDYVRSAWASMSVSHSSTEPQAFSPPSLPHSSSSNTMPHQHIPSNSMDQGIASPTPSSTTTSANSDSNEQSLSAADFFFVSYPFHEMQGGCGGDTMSCPCGDDCQCLGCAIHGNGVSVPGLGDMDNEHVVGNGCCGDEGGCPCGDDCQCIGCEFHKNVTMDGTDSNGSLNGNANGNGHRNGSAAGGSCCS